MISKTAFTSKKLQANVWSPDASQLAVAWLSQEMLEEKCFAHMFQQIVSVRETSQTTLGNTNLIASKHIKKDRKGLTCGRRA